MVTFFGSNPLAGVDVVENQIRLRVQYARHGLQSVEDEPAQMFVVHRADQQDHIEVAANQRNVVHLVDGFQGFSQLTPRVLLHLESDVGRGFQPGFDRVDDGGEFSQHAALAQLAHPLVGVRAADVDLLGQCTDGDPTVLGEFGQDALVYFVQRAGCKVGHFDSISLEIHNLDQFVFECAANWRTKSHKPHTGSHTAFQQRNGWTER